VRPAQRKPLAGHLIEHYRISIRRACRLCLLHTTTWHRKPRPPNPTDAPLTEQMLEIAHSRIRFGFWRIYVLMRRAGWRVNHKRLYRLYKAEGLNLRSKRPKHRRASAHRLERAELSTINQSWSMDFVSDALFNGQKFRALTVVDNFSRECLAIHVTPAIKAENVVNVLQGIVSQRAKPQRIQADNGPEFVSLVLDQWAYQHSITLDFSRPGTPTDNPFIESFNGRFRDECLNTHWFLSLQDAQRKIHNWRNDYNLFRPHSALGDITPALFAHAFLTQNAA
jgi:putative transposase